MCRLGRLYYARYKFVAKKKKKKKKIQNEAARIVSGVTLSVSIDNLYGECGWVTLDERRKQQKFIFMYKSVDGLQWRLNLRLHKVHLMCTLGARHL